MSADEFEQRVVRELPRLRAFLRRLCGQDAEDLAQDAVVRALRYRSSFDPTRSLASWLAKMAFRVYLDQRERRARESLEGQSVPVVARATHEAVDLADEVRSLLNQLSPVERDVLQAFHGQGEAIKEIAARLGLPIGTVKSHLHRAREKLIRGPR